MDVQRSKKEVENRRHFMRLLAHELRTPLAIVAASNKNFTGELAGLPAFFARSLSRQTHAIDQMRHIVDLCLTEERISAIGAETEPLSLSQIAHRLEPHLQAFVQARDPDAVCTLTGGARMIRCRSILSKWSWHCNCWSTTPLSIVRPGRTCPSRYGLNPDRFSFASPTRGAGLIPSSWTRNRFAVGPMPRARPASAWD